MTYYNHKYSSIWHNQTWLKVFLSKGGSIFFKWRAMHFFKGTCDDFWNLKNLLIKNHSTNFSQTWNKVSLGKGNSGMMNSYLSVDWMLAELQLNGDGKDGFQSHKSPFSRLNSRHISVIFQKLFFGKWTYVQRCSNPGCKNQSVSTLTIRPREPLLLLMNIWYICNVCLNLNLGFATLIFYSFHNYLVF